jgi:hypothetical protein
MCLPFPDLAERTLAKGVHCGFEWGIVHNGHGFRCGYVRLEPDHPWFEKSYDELYTLAPDLDVHGGLTFSQHGKPCPTHGEEAEWWIGFDCAHAGDAPDPTLPNAMRFGTESDEVRTTEYVKAECLSLAEQAFMAEAEHARA